MTNFNNNVRSVLKNNSNNVKKVTFLKVYTDIEVSHIDLGGKNLI